MRIWSSYFAYSGTEKTFMRRTINDVNWTCKNHWENVSVRWNKEKDIPKLKINTMRLWREIIIKYRNGRQVADLSWNPYTWNNFKQGHV